MAGDEADLAKLVEAYAERRGDVGALGEVECPQLAAQLPKFAEGLRDTWARAGFQRSYSSETLSAPAPATAPSDLWSSLMGSS